MTAFDPLEIAQQFTLHAYHHVIAKINPRELLLEENYEIQAVDKTLSVFEFDTGTAHSRKKRIRSKR